MSAEDMTIAEALAHANCSAALSSSPAHVAEALQVLAARVTELEAQQGEPAGTEWGFWWNGPVAEGGGIEPCGSQGIAEELARGYPGQGTVRQRDVYAPGPWKPVVS